MSRVRTFIDVDLSSRAAGFAGVFITLVVAGSLTEHAFLTMPQHEYPPVLLEIQSALIPEVSGSQINDDRSEVQPHPAVSAMPEQSHSRSDALRTSKEAAGAPKPTSAKAGNKIKDTRTRPVPPQRSGEAAQSTLAPAGDAMETAQKARQLVTGLILDQIRSSLVYPQRAVQRKLQGTVVMEFSIAGGIITSFRIARSSGHAILDSAASHLGEKLIGFDTHNDQHSLTLNVPVKYALIR